MDYGFEEGNVTYTVGLAPFAGYNRHHQDCYIFRIGDPYKPSFTTIIGKGGQPNIYGPFVFFCRLV